MGDLADKIRGHAGTNALSSLDVAIRWDGRPVSCRSIPLTILSGVSTHHLIRKLNQHLLPSNRQGDLFMSAFSNLGSGLSGDVKSRAGWGIVLGILTAVLGLLLIAYPLFTATITTIFIASILVIVGVLEVVEALRVHTAGAFFSRLLLGLVYGFAVITAILGFLILAHWPASTLWAIGTLVGVAVLIRGVTRIALCMGLRRVIARGEETRTRPPRAA